MKSSFKKKAFPDESILKSIREKLSDPSYKNGNVALAENATEVDKAKYQVCQLIAKYRREHNLTQRELAKQLEIDDSRISDILRGKMEGFTLDRLLGYAAKLHQNIRVQISAA